MVEWGTEMVTLDVSVLDVAVLQLHAPAVSVFSPLDPSWIGLQFHTDKETNINKR